jgi:deoxyribodipyrimidine photolyase-related protein
MSTFRERLDALSPPPEEAGDRDWIFVPYDQLTDAVGPLAAEDPEHLGIVLVETTWKPRQRPYHRQKLVFVVASLRHFALEQAARGVAVHHVTGDDPYAALLEPVARARGGLRMMEAAERELRADLQPLIDAGLLHVLPNETWPTSSALFERAFRGGRPWRMDRFYRAVRRETGLLMDEDGRPEGGKWSFDPENRKRWPGEPPAPSPPRFEVDDVTAEVVELVEQAFDRHPGRIDAAALAVRREDAETLWSWALAGCLPQFGPYEDAMSTESSGLFHTRISALLNNGRLLPRRVVDDVVALDVPLASREGFVRQVMGWREFMRHVHRATDGFREIGSGRSANVLGAEEPLPPAWWGTPSGLHCLDHVVEEVWATGYGHHITRLMVLSNLATLLGVDPQQLSDWFRVAYVDAYDWVVEPNVLGMGTFSRGDLFTTKPYVAGAAYIDRMSDYCGECRFAPRKDCPITSLYWDFLARNAKTLDGNPRMAMPLRSLEKRASETRASDARVRRWVVERLREGHPLDPEDRP